MEVTQLGAGHVDYLNNPNCGLLCSVCWPGVDPAATRSRAQTYTFLFLRHRLFGDAAAHLELLQLLARHTEEKLALVREKPERSS